MRRELHVSAPGAVGRRRSQTPNQAQYAAGKVFRRAGTDQTGRQRHDSSRLWIQELIGREDVRTETLPGWLLQ